MTSTTRTGSRGGMRAAALAGTVLLSTMGLADEDPYAGYVKLTRRDTSANSSWNAAGGWSDGLAPGATNDYYVAPGALLWRAQDKTDAGRTWNGGRLVLAGTFHSGVSEGDRYGPLIPDLVLLGGSELRTECYGPLYPVNGVTGTVTVAGTAADPATISHHYFSSFTSAGGARNHLLLAKFTGAADNVLQFVRPFTNYQPRAIDHGFFCRAVPATFADYPGTFKVTGGNTIFKPDVGTAFNWPQTALAADDGAECHFYANSTFTAATTNAILRSFAASGAKLFFNYSYVWNLAYPVVNVSERLALGEGNELTVNSNDFIPFIVGISAANPDGLSGGPLFHLGDGAELAGDLSSVTLKTADGRRMPFTNVTLRAVANIDGSRDVYIAAPGIVAMTNANVETTGYGGGSNPIDTPQYGAFEPGHPGDWSNGETPPAGSSLHYCAVARLCFFAPVDMPYATLSFCANSSWKGGGSIRFREMNFITGCTFGMWGAPRSRTISAERVNIVDSGAGSSSATLYAGQSHAINVDAEVCGDGNLTLRNMNDQPASIGLSRANTNFHGRITITQSPYTGYTPCQFTAHLGDARSWGGAFTGSTDTHNAILISRFPNVAVTNDVEFSDPTRGMQVLEGARFDVASNRTMRFANQVTYAGILEKTGAGTLDLAGTARFIDGAEGTAPAAGTNALIVSAGALKISSDTAADGLAVSFAEGTRLIVPSGSEAGYRNVKWPAPLAIDTVSGTLPVEIEMSGTEGMGDIMVPICTFSAAAAESIPASAFDVARASNGFRCKSVAKRANVDGSVSYVATLGLIGMQFIVR